MSTSMVETSTLFHRERPVHRLPALLGQQAFTRVNGRDPKKPRLAESGEGCADSTHGIGESIGLSDWASRPHRIAAHGPPRTASAVIAHAVTSSQPRPRCEAGSRPDGQHPVQQHHALVGPGREVAVLGRLDADVRAQFLVDVREAARHRPDVPVDREAEADRVAGRRVRVLADHQHPDVASGRWNARRMWSPCGR